MVNFVTVEDLKELHEKLGMDFPISDGVLSKDCCDGLSVMGDRQ